MYPPLRGGGGGVTLLYGLYGEVPAGFHSSPEFKSSATLVNSQLQVCLWPVGILN